MGEASWRRHHGGGITEEDIRQKAKRRHHGKCITGAACEAAGGLWESSRDVWGLSSDLGNLRGLDS